MGLPTWAFFGLTREATASLVRLPHTWGLALVRSSPSRGLLWVPRPGRGQHWVLGDTPFWPDGPSSWTSRTRPSGLYILIFEATIQIFKLYCLAFEVFYRFHVVYIETYEAVTCDILVLFLIYLKVASDCVYIYLATAWRYILLYLLVVLAVEGDVEMTTPQREPARFPCRNFAETSDQDGNLVTKAIRWPTEWQ